MAGKFLKTPEDFTCEVCGARVKGTGYTDHCPNCLVSKHVDINPGDRQSNCQGLMEPVGIDKRHGLWQIQYRCQKCAHERYNKISSEDNKEVLLTLSAPLKTLPNHQ